MKRLIPCIFIVLMCFLTACSEDKKTGSIISGNEIYHEKPSTSVSNEKDSNIIEMTAVISDIDNSTFKIKLRKIAIDKESGLEPTIVGTDTEFSYGQTGSIEDRYGTQITASQLKVGDIIDITYNRNSDYLTKIKVSDKVWEKKTVTGITVNEYSNTMTFANASYMYTDNTLAFYNNQREYVESIGKYDIVTLRGYNNTICSAVVEKSHGYVKLEGVTRFIGGYVAIGSSRVMVVEKDMVIEVTEGTHAVEISKDGVTAVKNVTISKGNTSVVTFTEYLQEATKKGTVEFNVVQEGISLYVDGVKVDYSKGVTLAYGVHYLTIVVDGKSKIYDSFVVDSLTMSLTIDLEAEQE